MGYEKILKALEDNKTAFNEDRIYNDMHEKLSNMIKVAELEGIFGIELKHSGNPNYIQLDYDRERTIARVKQDKYISWSDDDKQPEIGELLYVIAFPTGAYIFGEAYLTSVFNKFFNELKEYKPKYSDTHNHSLYFTPKTAKKVHEAYKDIFNKYCSIAKEEYVAQKKKKLEQQLKDLEKAK